jgi:hypothetical protein
MKPQNVGSGVGGSGRRNKGPIHIPQIPMEWMDPMCWRLPSGKALAEFALQAGFLAPLMLRSPKFKPRKMIVPPGVPAGPAIIRPGVRPSIRPGIEKGAEEAPEQTGSFREVR